MSLLPRGNSLPPEMWEQRHRGIVLLLWAHIPPLFAYALVQGVGLPHAAVEIASISALAAVAQNARRWPTVAMVASAFGLLTCSAVLVHLSEGLIEMHFHYFVIVGVVTLYQDWRPFLTAIGYVVVQHGVAGVIDPAAVYNHPAAVEDPWTWAAVHGAFILAMSATGMASWRLNESLLESVSDRGNRLAEAQSLAAIGSWESDLTTGEITWSEELFHLMGVDRAFALSPATIAERVHPEDREQFLATLAHTIRTGEDHDLDFRVESPDGEQRWLNGRAAVKLRSSGRTAVVAGTVQDVTERRRTEEVLRRQESDLLGTLSLLSATLDATADGILVVNFEGRITSCNRRFAEMWHIPPEVLDRRDDDAALACVLGQLAEPDVFLAKVRELYSQPEAESHDTLLFEDGRVFERFSTPQRVAGEVVGRVWSFRDVTERKRLEDELSHQAFHDALTGLANQALFRDRVEHAVERSRRNGARIAVLFVDLDDFKRVNDSLGHGAGDELLKAVSERFGECLRSGDTAARLGGDEFAVLLEDAATTTEVTVVAQRLIEVMQQPFLIDGAEVMVGASIGIAFGDDSIGAGVLLRNADLAMYAAKRRGKGRFEAFQPTMHAAAAERLNLEAELRRAINENELVVHYQPIVSLQDSRVLGTEALVRWRHPDRGLLGPDVFIEIAEQSGAIDAIGRMVLRTAVQQLRAWQVEFADPTLSVSVNLSPRQLRERHLVREVAGALARTGIDPATLTLEITEGAVMDDPESALEQLQALKDLGVQLAVDDFGTGYSSLGYLKRFPIDVLKIDRSFVQGIDQGAEESSLARAIVRIAHTLRLRAVAEGVETAGQAAVLRSIRCECAQGYLYARPLPAEEVAPLLRPATLAPA